ncbi:putative monooxygenase protein [Meredithblackwellia eburnea MCA 4105]
MSPIALNDNVAAATQGSEADARLLNLKEAAKVHLRKPLPDHGEPVKKDYMYAFKYNHELPTHGAEGVEVPATTDATAVAQDLVARLSKTLGAGDAKGFAGLFLEYGVWRDRSAFTFDYRTFNWHAKILKAAEDLLPLNPVKNISLIAPSASIERPYPDLSFVQAHLSFDTQLVGASALVTLILTPNNEWRIWTLNTAIESLHGFPEIPLRDGHMTGDVSWATQRGLDTEAFAEQQPDVLIIGGGQNGLMTAARLKALGVSALVIERNARIGDNWRGRYEALSLHLPHYADHFAYFPYPEHWPMYCPAQKLGDWFEWYVSAMELNVWTSSTVSKSSVTASGEWTVEIERNGTKTTFHPRQLIMATSLAGVAYSPTIPGRAEFKGTVRHSTTHDSSRDWVGKRVLVVGTSSSGFDTAYDFARRGIDVTILQRSPTYIMSLTHSVPRVLSLYTPVNGKRPDLDVADRLAYGTPVGPSEEMGRRLGKELTELDYDLLEALEARGFKTWRGQRATSTQTLGYTKNGGFYFDAGACEHIINGNIKVEQGYIDHFTKDKVVLNGNREENFDLVVLATGFSNTIDSVRRTLGEDVASRCKPIWGMDEEGELNSAWRSDVGVPNLWIMVGTLQAARYHSKKVALRIKARLEGIAPEPYQQ